MAAKYLDGQGFNDGTGFLLYGRHLRNNDASADQRPDTFCGESRSEGDWYLTNNPNSAYNRQWFSHMAAVEDYLDGLGYLDRFTITWPTNRRIKPTTTPSPGIRRS
ncbi:MAG: hypothetical protein R2932_07220 [Caldilineaceae bacterium]